VGKAVEVGDQATRATYDPLQIVPSYRQHYSSHDLDKLTLGLVQSDDAKVFCIETAWGAYFDLFV
jgi:hypothetical protein